MVPDQSSCQATLTKLEFSLSLSQTEKNRNWTEILQYTEEKLGQAERTEMEPEYQALEKKADLTKSYTEKIKNNTAAVIVPNPGKANMWYFAPEYTALQPYGRKFSSSTTFR